MRVHTHTHTQLQGGSYFGAAVVVMYFIYDRLWNTASRRSLSTEEPGLMTHGQQPQSHYQANTES